MNPLLKAQWETLELHRKKYEDEIRETSFVQQNFRPGPERWSILQVIRHLVTTEELGVNFLISKGYGNARRQSAWSHAMRSFFLGMMLKSSLKFRVPKKVKMPELEQDAEVLLKDWQEIRGAFFGYLKDFPEEKMNYLIFRHPISGWLTMPQTLDFYIDHIKHHRRQVNRIKKAADFPA